MALSRFKPKLSIPTFRGGFAQSAHKSSRSSEWIGSQNFWPILLGAHSKVLDIGPGKAHGTLAGGLASSDWVYDPAFGGSALTFDAVDDYVQTNSHVVKNALSAVTVMVIFRAASTNLIRHIVWEGDVNGNGGGTQPEFAITIADATTGTGDLISLFCMGASSTRIVANTGFTDTADFHMAIARLTNLKGSTVTGEVFLDGVLAVTDTCTGPIPQSGFDTGFRIGRPGTPTREMHGEIAEVRTWNRGLTNPECRALFDDFDAAIRPKLLTAEQWLVVAAAGAASYVIPRQQHQHLLRR